MTADALVYLVIALAVIGLLRVCEIIVGFAELRGWLDDPPLPWEQDERGAA